MTRGPATTEPTHPGTGSLPLARASEASRRAGGGYGVNLAAASQDGPSSAPQRPGGYLDPSARADAAGGPPEAPASITLPDGREVPADLTALLGMRHGHVARWLVAAGIETSADLLTLDEEARRYTPGMGAARWAKVAAALPEGVMLGCLAPRAVEPVQLRALDGGRKAPRIRPLDLSFLEEEASNG